MKDEIKEILDKILLNCDTQEEKNKILDYITNLQEENERLKQSILNAIDKMNSEMVMINDRGYYYTDISALEDILQINDKDFIDYKSRNEKAIEYIKQLEYSEWITFGRKILLEILNGGDEE